MNKLFFIITSGLFFIMFCLVSIPIANNLILDLTNIASYEVAIFIYCAIIIALFLMLFVILKKISRGSLIILVGAFFGITVGSIVSILVGVYF